MNLEDRIGLHVRMARAYGDAYLRQGVQDGEKFVDVWKFHPDCMYASPYFTGDEAFKLSEFPEDSARASTMEARVYSLRFPDWKPVDFRYWPADNGFVMKTRWQGTHSDTGNVMGFYSYSFIDTDDDGEVTRWETHVNSEYSDFLDVAIGVHGPFRGTHEYTDALERRLTEEGLTV